jgi:guanosine-3',5'-bis(diphosphate) 3'-pyrophosphohydrolase
MNSILQQVKDFAQKAHGEQKRKYTGKPYIVHPEAVMKITQEYTDNVAAHAAALLHDVLEDTEVEPEEMQKFLFEIMEPEDATLTFKLVNDLTDIYTKEKYPQYNRRKRKELEAKRLEKSHTLSQTIKYADLIDNTIDITLNDQDFAKLFVAECINLLEHIKDGDQNLYKKAKETADSCRKEIMEYYKKRNQPSH